MSQPGTLPIPTPAVPTGQQTARLAALNADGEHAIETLPIESVAADVGVEKVAATRPTGPELPGVDSKPCSYLSLFRCLESCLSSAGLHFSGTGAHTAL